VVQIASSVREGLRVGSLHGASTIIVERGADGSDSLKVVEALRAADDQTPVMVVGVSESVEERIAYIRSGADDYLARPFDLREMTARVEALLRGPQDGPPRRSDRDRSRRARRSVHGPIGRPASARIHAAGIFRSSPQASFVASTTARGHLEK